MGLNIISVFLQNVALREEACCFHYVKDGQWHKLSWKQAACAVEALCSLLKEKGISPKDRVAILSQTRVEWTIADLAVLALGAVTVPIYPTYPAARIEHIIRDAEVKLIFVEDPVRVGEIEKITSGLSAPPHIVSFAGEGKNPVALLPKLLAAAPSGQGASPKDGEDIKAADLATIIYTSGTTGQPKGVVLTHGNITAEIDATRQIFHFEPEEIGLLCLPLSHVLGRLMQYHQLADGYQLAFLEAYDKFADNCRDVRPHFIVGVPRILEKFYERLEAMLQESASWKRRLFNWAAKVGQERGAFVQKHRDVPSFLACKYLVAELLVFRKLKARLGERLKIFFCGGAPLAKNLAKFFHGMGLLVLEGYGLTETFAAATVNRPDDYHFGTVGKPIPGLKIKLAPDGEILMQGPTVFREYLNLPEEMAQAKTPDGWFYTGDIGEFSKDGFLRITDRKKDIIVTSGGQNVAPQMIETGIQESRFINYCMVYGDKKKYLTALVTLNGQAVSEYAQKMGIAGTVPELARHPKIFELIASIIDEKNRQLAPHETIKKFAILEQDFSQETGELTPTLKVRRKFTGDKYRPILDALYRE